MLIFTPQERTFLRALLWESGRPPFSGPATKILESYGIRSFDFAFMLKAILKEEPDTSTTYSIGEPCENPVFPWGTLEEALNKERAFKWKHYEEKCEHE